MKPIHFLTCSLFITSFFAIACGGSKKASSTDIFKSVDAIIAKIDGDGELRRTDKMPSELQARLSRFQNTKGTVVRLINTSTSDKAQDLTQYYFDNSGDLIYSIHRTYETNNPEKIVLSETKNYFKGSKVLGVFTRSIKVDRKEGGFIDKKLSSQSFKEVPAPSNLLKMENDAIKKLNTYFVNN